MSNDAAQIAMARGLPSVDAVLRTPRAAGLVERFGRTATVEAIRAAIAAARAEPGAALSH